jgi:hypothetical protein
MRSRNGDDSALSRFASVAFFAVLLTVLLAPVPAAQASSGSYSINGLVAEDGILSSALAGRGMVSDWDHTVQVVSWLRYRLPQRRVVYLLGGSATRESVTSESAWAAQLSRLTGRSATTFVCASSCQTFEEDALIVKQLPRYRGSVLISVGLSRFNMLHPPALLPSYSIRRTAPVPWFQHHYDLRPSLTYAQKRRVVREWLEDKYPVFQSRNQARLADLEKVIEACEARGLRVALLEMPLNLPVVGDDFDEALATYRSACLELAEEHGIKYIRFLSAIGLQNKDFHDLQHLLPSGRSKWQARLSRELVRNGLI